MNSTSRWICSCVRDVVPSKSMCSRKWDAPFVAGVSSRTPDSTATVEATIGFERDSRNRTRSPLESTVSFALCRALCGAVVDALRAAADVRALWGERGGVLGDAAGFRGAGGAPSGTELTAAPEAIQTAMSAAL